MTLRQRLLAFVGLVVIVGGVVGILIAAGAIGNQAGGEGIKPVTMLDASPASGAPKVGTDVGELAPDFEISGFDGTRHRLSDFRGKVVYINFWATSCIPCQVEMPDIQQLERAHPDQLAVISVNRREPLDRAKDFVANVPLRDGGKGVSFTVNGMDPDDTLYDTYVRAFPPPMPASIIVDPRGVISKVYNGQLQYDQMEQAFAEAQKGAPPQSP